jgi:hypothetical protein
VLFTKYCEQIEEDLMAVCRRHGRDEKRIQTLVRKLEGKKHTGVEKGITLRWILNKLHMYV